jgi:hypothetical protein
MTSQHALTLSRAAHRNVIAHRTTSDRFPRHIAGIKARIEKQKKTDERRHQLASAIGLASVQLWTIEETGLALLDVLELLRAA